MTPAKEEKNETEAKDGAREKEKREKHCEILKFHFKKIVFFSPLLKLRGLAKSENIVLHGITRFSPKCPK